MGIQAVLESLDDVQAEIKPLYKENDDGRFVLDVEGIDDHPKVRGVIAANRTNKETRDKLRAELEAVQSRLAKLPDDFDPDTFQEMKAQLEKGVGPDIEERLARQRAKLEEKYQAEIKAREEKLGTKDSVIRKMLIDDGLSKAMDDAAIDPRHKSKLVPYLKTVGKIVIEEQGESYKAAVDTDLGPVSLSQFVADWASSEDGKEYVAKSTGPKPRGGDGKGQSGTITRAEFDAMGHSARAQIAKDGVRVIDA